MTIEKLADSLGTNAKYAARIVEFYRQKKVSHYITDLRVRFVIMRLQTDPAWRKYSLKVMASEAGFFRSDALSRAFHEATGVALPDFVSRLENQSPLQAPAVSAQ
jgi:AraC-like DNA-binding protein